MKYRKLKDGRIEYEISPTDRYNYLESKGWLWNPHFPLTKKWKARAKFVKEKTSKVNSPNFNWGKVIVAKQRKATKKQKELERYYKKHPRTGSGISFG